MCGELEEKVMSSIELSKYDYFIDPVCGEMILEELWVLVFILVGIAILGSAI